MVDYIEKYEPELIDMLMPVQSPLMCTAIYARKQLGIGDKLAFISPCIAKKMEIDAPENGGLVSYNVTFDHLLEYLCDHDIAGAPCEDELPYELGTIWPMPGGLAEYARWLMGDDVFIRQIDGELKVIEYLHSHAEEIKNRQTPYLFIDALNCERGCLCGTATELRHARSDKALYQLIALKQQAKAQSALTGMSPEARMAELDRRFRDLDLKDYVRTYRDRSSAGHAPARGGRVVRGLPTNAEAYEGGPKHQLHGLRLSQLPGDGERGLLRVYPQGKLYSLPEGFRGESAAEAPVCRRARRFPGCVQPAGIDWQNRSAARCL